jgi:hypothetical protein
MNWLYLVLHTPRKCLVTLTYVFAPLHIIVETNHPILESPGLQQKPHGTQNVREVDFLKVFLIPYYSSSLTAALDDDTSTSARILLNCCTRPLISGKAAECHETMCRAEREEHCNSKIPNSRRRELSLSIRSPIAPIPVRWRLGRMWNDGCTAFHSMSFA